MNTNKLLRIRVEEISESLFIDGTRIRLNPRKISEGCNRNEWYFLANGAIEIVTNDNELKKTLKLGKEFYIQFIPVEDELESNKSPINYVIPSDHHTGKHLIR